MSSTAINPSLVYGATAAAQWSASIGQPDADVVHVPRDLLAMWLTTAHSQGTLDGIRRFKSAMGLPTC